MEELLKYLQTISKENGLLRFVKIITSKDEFYRAVVASFSKSENGYFIKLQDKLAKDKITTEEQLQDYISQAAIVSSAVEMVINYFIPNAVKKLQR